MEQSHSSFHNCRNPTDYILLLQLWKKDVLRKAAIEHRLSRPRSLAWAVMLRIVPKPTTDVVIRIESYRIDYQKMLGSKKDPRRVIDDDPLSQKNESAWKQYFHDRELKALILQDVVRTFPDDPYFRDPEVQRMMVRVLFHWARQHPHIGYRQGMHEILAPLLYELYIDRIKAPPHDQLSDILKHVLDPNYLEHDSYMLFDGVMKGINRFYTTGDAVPSTTGRLPTSTTAHSPNEVSKYLEKVRENYLVPLDPELAAHLEESNITMEVFGIRWLRLLFGREFPRSEIPLLWGFLFCDGPMLPNLHYVIVAMMIAIRSTLMNSDPAVVLSALMRPLPTSVEYVCALALHLQRPQDYPKPPPPPVQPPPQLPTHHSTLSTQRQPQSSRVNNAWNIEQHGSEDTSPGSGDSSSEGVPEGADVARELAALALVRAQLPNAAAALASALPKPPPEIAQPLQQILQLAALVQCRNHALIDVETALEAAEGQTSEKVGRRQLVPIVPLMLGRKRATNEQINKPISKAKEVPLTLFHEMECDNAVDFPSLDPLRLRID